MSAVGPSPEVALLLHCARAATGSGESEPVEATALARSVTRWELFISLASRHAIVPLASQRLARAATDAVPPSVLTSLRTVTEQSAMRSLRLAGDLVTVTNALSGSAIDSIAFKGPTLASLLYGNLSLRQFEDLDILVHPHAVRQARGVLLALDYSAVLEFNEDQRASLLLSGHHEQFVNRETGTTIERHWWENRQQTTIGGVAMYTLGVEQLLLYLCMHGGKHSWRRVSWLCDFQRALIRYPTADWSNVLALAAQNGTLRMVGIGFKLLDTLFDDSERSAALKAAKLRDPDVDRVSSVIVKRLLDTDTAVPALDFNVQIQSRERLRDRLRYAWHVLVEPHPADVSLFGLPRAIYGMYFIFRPLRLTLKYLGRLLRPYRVA
jgi:putative nucleotidyltransferase-like protein